MQCMLFGDKITFAPNIKNWWQAIALGGANYIGGIMEGMMAGAAVGMGGALISGARTAFLSGGTRAVGQAGLNFLKVMPKNFGVNLLESVSKFGLAMRGIMGAQNTAATYGNTGTASIGDFAKGTVAMETGAYDSANLIYADMSGGVILDENGTINTTAKIVEGALFGVMVGMGAGLLKGLTQLATPTLSSIGANVIGSFGTLGSSVRAVFGIQNATHSWAMGNDLISIETGEAFFDGAIPEYESIKRIGTGNAEPQDAMMLLYLLHLKNPSVTKEKPVTEEQIVEEPTKNTKLNEPEPIKKKGDGEAFEASPKPKNSPDIAKWEAKGGKVEVNGDTWKYTDWEGNVVEYKNGYPDFEPYSRQSVDIGKQEGNYSSDFKNAENKSKEIPPKLGKDETVWHHHEDGKTMQEVDRTIHDRFTHRGGVSEGKKVSLGKK